MKGTTPAPWYLEVDGQTQGPYTSEEIMKLVMDGSLKVESRIFDSAANAWKLAADVIPYLNLSSPKTEPGWQPPPKPTELRDIHVVDLNLEATGGVDYFALISDRKREVERAAAEARAAEAKAAATQALTRPTSAADGSQPRRLDQTSNRSLLGAARRTETPKIVRVAPPIEETRPAAAIREVSPDLGRDGIIIKEAESESVFGRVRDFVAANTKPLAAAAALGFVFVGTYGVIRSLGDRSDNRLPATAEPKQEKREAEKPRRVGVSASRDSLGSGKNRARNRQSSNVSRANVVAEPPVARVVPPQPTETPQNEPLREEAQFFSSRELAEQPDLPPVTPTPVPPQNQAHAPEQDPYYDPNNQASSFVDPPGYIPPTDPAYDPSRTPTNDPNAPQPQPDTATQ